MQLNLFIFLPLTLQGRVLHSLLQVSVPSSHPLPPCAGAGLSHSLLQVSVPPPQLREHPPFNLFQLPQEPSTGPVGELLCKPCFGFKERFLHLPVLQDLNCEGSPWQYSPPLAGPGESHRLERYLAPPPQLWEQLLQLFHPPH